MAVCSAGTSAVTMRYDSCGFGMLPLAPWGLAQLSGRWVQLCKLCMFMTLQHDRYVYNPLRRCLCGYDLSLLCCQVNAEFLEYTRSQGNDLSTPAPHFNFPGRKPGDRWCLCASRCAASSSSSSSSSGSSSSSSGGSRNAGLCSSVLHLCQGLAHSTCIFEHAVHSVCSAL
jgi:hypothetical protein